MTNLTDEELDRLPRYAEREIRRLARDLADARETIGGIDNGETDTYWRSFLTGPPGGPSWEERYLPDGASVIFDGSIEVRVETRGTGGRRVVVSTNDGALRIRPQSSNVVEVSAERL